MALKDLNQLATEIDQAVHTNGALGKTTAASLNALLKSLATELTTLPSAIVGNPDTEFTSIAASQYSPGHPAAQDLMGALAYLYAIRDSANTAKILFVRGYGQTLDGLRGNSDRPYRNLTEAHNAASDGDTILVLPGGTGVDAFGRACYQEQYTQTKAVRVVCMPGVVFSGGLVFGGYGGYASKDYVLQGGEYLNFILLYRQGNGPSTLLLENIKVTGLGRVQYGGNHYFNHQDSLVIRNSWLESMQLAGGLCPVVNSGRTEFGPGTIELDNCVVVSQHTSCLQFQGAPGSKIIVKGNTQLRPGAGFAAVLSAPVSPYGTISPLGDWYVDERATANLVDGKIPIAQLSTRDPYTIQDNAEVTGAVIGGLYTNGELQKDSANYSVATDSTVVAAGDQITGSNYLYQYCRLASGSLGWVRTTKA